MWRDKYVGFLVFKTFGLRIWGLGFREKVSGERIEARVWGLGLGVAGVAVESLAGIAIGLLRK